MFSIYGVTIRQFVASVFLDTLVTSYPLHWPSIVTLVTFERDFHDLTCSVYMESLPVNLWLPFSMRHLSKSTHSIAWPPIVTLTTFEGNLLDLIRSVYMESPPVNLWLPFSMRQLSEHTHYIGLLS